MVSSFTVTGVAVALMLAAGPARAARPYDGPTAVEGMDAPVPAPVPEREAEPEPEPEGPDADVLAPIEDDPADDYDPLRDSPEAQEARSMTRGGAILVTAAAALGIGAVAMGLSDPCTPEAGNSCLPSSRNRAALAMGIPGIAMLGGGVALLAVGARRKARLRASLALAPVLSRQGGGLTALVQF